MLKKRNLALCVLSFIVTLMLFTAYSGSIPAFAASAPPGRATTYIVGTSTSTGSVYQVVAGLAQVINPHLAANGISIRAISSNGGPNNIQMMAEGEILFAAHASVSTVQGIKGELAGMAPTPFMRGICGLYPSVFHFLTPKNRNITSFEQMRGTTGAPGPVGGSTEIYVRELLSVVDITIDDFRPVYLDTTGTVDNLRDGRVDWGILPLSVPASWVVDLTLTGNFNILPIEGELRDNFLTRYPHYVPFTIPGGTYAGIPDPLETAAVVICLYAHEDADDDVVYNITKALWENLEEFKQVNAGLSYMNEDTIISGLGSDLHPGAMRYWREIGVLK